MQTSKKVNLQSQEKLFLDEAMVNWSLVGWSSFCHHLSGYLWMEFPVHKPLCWRSWPPAHLRDCNFRSSKPLCAPWSAACRQPLWDLSNYANCGLLQIQRNVGKGDIFPTLPLSSARKLVISVCPHWSGFSENGWNINCHLKVRQRNFSFVLPSNDTCHHTPTR